MNVFIKSKVVDAVNSCKNKPVKIDVFKLMYLTNQTLIEIIRVPTATNYY